MLNRNDVYEAMKNEAYARCRYEIFAEQARNQGLHYFSKVLLELSRNELSHFREFMKILNLRDTLSNNLKTAIKDERLESDEIYPKLYENAMADQNLETARLFQQIAKIEKLHKERLIKLSKLLDSDMVLKRSEKIKWKCRTCGYIHEGKEPPNKCPACQSGKNFYEPADFNI